MAGKHDARFWKKQYDELVAKFKGLKVDPEAHDKVVADLATARAEVSRLKQQVGGLKGRITQMQERHDQQLQELLDSNQKRSEIHEQTTLRLHAAIDNQRQSHLNAMGDLLAERDALRAERDALQAADTDMRTHYTLLFAALRAPGIRRLIQGYQSRGLQQKDVHRAMRVLGDLHRAVTSEGRLPTAGEVAARMDEDEPVTGEEVG